MQLVFLFMWTIVVIQAAPIFAYLAFLLSAAADGGIIFWR